MNNNLYMFGLLLLVMTIISSFGGAIRIEENFYTEVFDLLDDEKVEVVEGNDEVDLATTSMELEGADKNMHNEASVPEKESEPVLPKPVVVEEENNADVNVNVNNIEAYDSEQYATF